VQYDDDIVSA
jgi:hypothetical protein